MPSGAILMSAARTLEEGRARMPPLVVSTALLSCTMGAAPAPLTVVPKGIPVTAGGQLVATTMDMVPMANIPTFVMCMSPANPAVVAATAAALGVPTPMPCVPIPLGPWLPGSTKVLLGGLQVLTAGSTCQCSWAGVISIGMPGQLTVEANG